MSVVARPEVKVTDATSFAAASGATPEQVADLTRFLEMLAAGNGREGFHVHLVESMAKRCRFLSDVVRALDLPATVHNDRAENLKLSVDIVTARACAPLHRLLGYAQPYFRLGATGLFLKGQDVAADIEEATRFWDFEAETVPSASDERGRIVRVRRLGRARKV